jgi:hypothetical protein
LFVYKKFTLLNQELKVELDHRTLDKYLSHPTTQTVLPEEEEEEEAYPEEEEEEEA